MARRDRAGLAPFADCFGPYTGQTCGSLRPAQALDDRIHAECHAGDSMGSHFPAQLSAESPGNFLPPHNPVTLPIVGRVFSSEGVMSLREHFTDQLKASMK